MSDSAHIPVHRKLAFAAFLAGITILSSLLGGFSAAYLAAHTKSKPALPQSIPTSTFEIAPGVRDHFTILCPYCHNPATVYLHVPNGVKSGHVNGEVLTIHDKEWVQDQLRRHPEWNTPNMPVHIEGATKKDFNIQETK